MRESPLPIEFEGLSDKVHYVVERIRGKEWSSSCPQCGGEPHTSGEFPDRFRMWPVGKAGIPWGWCRTCNYKWYPKKDFKPDPAKVEEWRLARLEYETRIKSEAELAIANLTDKHKWDEYYAWLAVDKNATRLWREAGIGEEYWLCEWKLGFDPMHAFWYDDNGWKEWQTPTMTIPVRDIGGRIVNIKHRLLKPMPDGTKYRMEYKTGIEPIFIANLDLLNKADYVIKCEGEKKAAVVFLTIDSPNVQVIGLPKSPSDTMLSSISAQTIVDFIDPDVSNKTIARTSKIYSGRHYSYVRLPIKVDDMIVKYGMDKDDLRAQIQQARKI